MNNNISRLRREFHLTQSELAKRLNTSTTNIGYYEQGKRDLSTKLLHSLATFFNCSIDYLLQESDSGIKIYYEGDNIIEYIIDEAMLNELIKLNVVYYKEDSLKRYLNPHLLFGLNKDINLDSIMNSINSLKDLEIIEHFPLTSKNDLDKLYCIIKIKELDNDKAHIIKNLLELI